VIQAPEGHPLHCQLCRERWYAASPEKRDEIRSGIVKRALAITLANPEFQKLLAALAEND
jgi:hypothetical protein